MRQPKRIRAKYAGQCPACNAAIHPGDSIYWYGRGRGAQHVNCESSRLRACNCTSCNGSGKRWNNAPCAVCDGTGSRDVQELAKRRDLHRVDPMGVDRAFEDDCARRCGL